MERQAKTVGKKYEELQKELRANRLRARNVEKRVRELETEIAEGEPRRSRKE